MADLMRILSCTNQKLEPALHLHPELQILFACLITEMTTLCT